MRRHASADLVLQPGERGGRSPRRVLRPLLALWPFLRAYRGTVLLALTALVAAAVAGLALPIGVRLVIDDGFSAESARAVDRYFLLLFALAALLALASASRFYLVTWLGERVVADVRRALYRHVIRLSPTFFEANRAGEVLSRLTGDTTLVQSIAGADVSIALRSMLTFAGGLVMLSVTSPRLTGVILILIPLVLIPLLFYGRRVRKLSRATQDRVAEASGFAGETIHAIQTVQAFNLEETLSARFVQTIASSFETAVRRIRARALLTAFAILIVFGAIVFVLWLGAQSVMRGTMSAGELGQFLLYAVLVAGSAASLSEIWSEIQRGAGAVERIVELLAERPGITAPAEPVALPQPPEGRVEMRDVSFHYPSRPEVPALSGLAFTVAPGETVALVGPSGAGKSTIFQLLLRFHDPSSGQVLIDGVDIAHVDPGAVRARIAIVPQETVVFAADVLENIRFGRPDASDDEVLAAARAAGVEDFVSALPDRYHTFLGERGTRLSGGQRQRIAIARALLKDPAIMLLDEATSALDAESERLVQRALAGLMSGRTTLVIAHRLATVLSANRIIVMDSGRIVAEGTHASLLESSSLYAHLAALQFESAAEPEPVRIAGGTVA